jgi:thiol-disulfide isomerase/thioredoxin
MFKKFLFTFAFALSLSSTVMAQKPAAGSAIIPYKRATPAVKQNPVGIYPALKNGKAWEGTEPGSYSLKFIVKGLAIGDTVYLADYHLDGKYRRDTAIVDKKGMANFTGNRKLQRGFYLFVLPHVRDYFEFIVDDDQDFTIATDTAYWTREYYPKMKVTGSDQNAAYLAYQLGKAKIIQQIIEIDEHLKADTNKAVQKPLLAKRMVLLQQKGDYDSVYMAKHPDHLLSHFLYAMEDIVVPTEIQNSKDSTAAYKYYKTHYWDHIDFGDDGMVRLPLNILKQKFDFYFDKVIPPDADTCLKAAQLLMAKSANTIEVEKYVIWYMTNRFETSNIMGMDKAFVLFAKETYCSGKAWWVDSATVRHMCDNARDRSWTLIGKDAPPIELADKNGVWHNTADVKAPYTIVIFWDPTCGHCREVMPKLAKIYAENKEKGWKVIALAPMDKRKEWLEYQTEHPEMSEFLHLLRGEVRSDAWADNLRKYYVIASPTIFVLNEQKVVEANRIDVDKIVDFIDHLTKMKNRKSN